MSDEAEKVKNAGLSVRILAPTRSLYEGNAVSVTAKNKIGQFDILVGHANFFSLLITSDIIVDTSSSKITFGIKEGLIKVKSNVVTIFVDIEPQHATT